MLSVSWRCFSRWPRRRASVRSLRVRCEVLFILSPAKLSRARSSSGRRRPPEYPSGLPAPAYDDGGAPTTQYNWPCVPRAGCHPGIHHLGADVARPAPASPFLLSDWSSSALCSAPNYLCAARSWFPGAGFAKTIAPRQLSTPPSTRQSPIPCRSPSPPRPPCPNSACAIGETCEILPAAASASVSAVILLSISMSRKILTAIRFMVMARQPAATVLPCIAKYINYTWANFADYRMHLNADQDMYLDLKAGFEAQEYKDYVLQTGAQGFPLNLDLQYLTSAATPNTASTVPSDYGTNSIFLQCGVQL